MAKKSVEHSPAAYQAVNHDDPETDQHSFSSSTTMANERLELERSRSWFSCHHFLPKSWMPVITIFSIFCMTIIAVSAISRDRFSSIPAQMNRLKDSNKSLPPLCGTSPEEALSSGCTFDVYINGWVPRACYDRTVAVDSESNSSVLAPGAAGEAVFPIYWDKDFKKPATVEDLKKTAFDNGEEGEDKKFYTTYGYHRAHCMHLWRLSGSAMEKVAKGEKGIGVYYKVASFEHTIHCNTVVLEYDKDPHAVDTIIPGVCRCVGLDDVWYQYHGWGGREQGIGKRRA